VDYASPLPGTFRRVLALSISLACFGRQARREHGGDRGCEPRAHVEREARRPGSRQVGRRADASLRQPLPLLGLACERPRIVMLVFLLHPDEDHTRVGEHSSPGVVDLGAPVLPGRALHGVQQTSSHTVVVLELDTEASVRLGQRQDLVRDVVRRQHRPHPSTDVHEHAASDVHGRPKHVLQVASVLFKVGVEDVVELGDVAALRLVEMLPCALLACRPMNSRVYAPGPP
jgi:hypothetical protein